MVNIDIFDIMKNAGQLTKLVIYPARQRETDPYEHTTEEVLLPSIIIKAIVSDESFGGLRYKYFGEIPAGSKKCIIEKKYLNLLKNCRKIMINDEEYTVYRDADKNFQILEKQDYLLVILARS